MAYLSFEQLDSTSFRISVMSLRTNVGKTIYLFDFDKNNSVVRESVPLDAAFPYYYWDINDVSPNATYNVRVTILYDDGDIQTLDESYTTSAGSTSTAELSFPSEPSELVTSTSCLVQISNMRSGTKWITVSFDSIAKVSKAEESVAQTIYIINGLNPNTTYNVGVVIEYSDGGIEYLTGVYTTQSGGGSSATEWSVEYRNSYSDVEETLSLNYDLLSGEVARIRVSFANSGTATFYSTGNYDPIAFLSNSSSFGTSSGKPSNCLVEKDQGGEGNNFSFTYDVEAGTEYYLFVRHYYINDSGNVTVYIVSPSGSSSDDEWSVYDCITYDNLSSTQVLDAAIETGVVTRVTFTCKNSGDITIYSEGNLDVIGFISKESFFDAVNGEPDLDYESNDDGGTGYNFSITYKIVAGETYYLWVRGIDKTVSGDIVIYINPPSGSTTNRPSYFSWDAPKVSGATFNITASEWKKLLDNIKEVCIYKGLSSVNSTSNQSVIDSFYYPSKGDEFKASMYNQCIYQFARLGLISYSDYSVESGDTITAVRINFLRDTINNVE